MFKGNNKNKTSKNEAISNSLSKIEKQSSIVKLEILNLLKKSIEDNIREEEADKLDSSGQSLTLVFNQKGTGTTSKESLYEAFKEKADSLLISRGFKYYQITLGREGFSKNGNYYLYYNNGSITLYNELNPSVKPDNLSEEEFNKILKRENTSLQDSVTDNMDDILDALSYLKSTMKQGVTNPNRLRIKTKKRRIIS